MLGAGVPGVSLAWYLPSGSNLNSSGCEGPTNWATLPCGVFGEDGMCC